MLLILFSTQINNANSQDLPICVSSGLWTASGDIEVNFNCSVCILWRAFTNLERVLQCFRCFLMTFFPSCTFYIFVEDTNNGKMTLTVGLSRNNTTLWINLVGESTELDRRIPVFVRFKLLLSISFKLIILLVQLSLATVFLNREEFSWWFSFSVHSATGFSWIMGVNSSILSRNDD